MRSAKMSSFKRDSEDILFCDLLKKFKLSENEEVEDDGEETDDDDDEEEADVHILGIGCDVWVHSILSHFNAFEVLKFFHVNRGFYVIACLALQNRKAKSDRVLKLIMDKNPAERFLFKLVEWDCFDRVLNCHIFRHAIRKGYFQLVKMLSQNDGDCSVKEWILDILEQMIVHLENRGEALFEGYASLLEEFKNDIDWDELSSPESFNILCVNKEMHDYVRSKLSSQETDYDDIFKTACEYEYMNTMEYFLKNEIFEKSLSEEALVEGWRKITSKDPTRSRNLTKLLDILIPFLPYGEIVKYIFSVIDDPSKYTILEKFFQKRKDDLISKSKSENNSTWYGSLKRICELSFFETRTISTGSVYYDNVFSYRRITNKPYHKQREEILSLVKLIIDTFQIDPSFENNILLSSSCINGNYELANYLLHHFKSVHFRSLKDPKRMVMSVSHFGLFPETVFLEQLVEMSDFVVDGYFKVMKLLLEHGVDLSLGGKNEPYKSLYFVVDEYGHPENMIRRMMSLLRKDDRVSELVKKEGQTYPKLGIRRSSNAQRERRTGVALRIGIPRIEQEGEDDWDDDDDW